MNAARHPDEDALPAGTWAGEYQIEALIGRGMFGTVYRARHPVIGAPAAVKVLGGHLARDPAMVNRFIDEARAASKARHPSIVEIFNFGRLPDGRRYFVMELLEGEPLDALLAREEAVPLARCVALLAPIAEALAVAHAAGVTHRDVKPANIFVCSEGPPKLVDFGVAKLLDGRATRDRTAQGVLIGTPSYMAPEQCLGEAITPAADVYALGVVAWRMLAGRLPFTAETAVEVMNAHISDAPPPLHRERAELGPATTAAVEAMLAKDPRARPAPVEAIAALAASGGVGRPRRGPALAIAGAAVIALGALGWALWPADPPPQPIRQAPSTTAPGVTAATAPSQAALPEAPMSAPPTLAPKLRVQLIGLPADGTVHLGDVRLTLDPEGRAQLTRARLPATLRIEAPGHMEKTVEVTADTPAIDARLERVIRRERPTRRTDPHGIDPW